MMTQDSTERLQRLSGTELAEIVRRHIDSERVNDPLFKDIAFAVDGDHIIRTPEYVRVRVRPLKDPVRSGYLYGFLADVNVHLIDDEGLNILLLPEDVDEESPSETRELVPA